jgi:Uma2 family endonuclease
LEAGVSEGAIRRMSADEFLQWDLTAPDHRHELVDGIPRAMTGASRRHDRIVMNIKLALGNQLRGSNCEPFSADVAVKMPNRNVRRPDIGVDCGDIDERATSSPAPIMLVEVMSLSTRAVDRTRKLDEYKSLPGLAHVLLVEPEMPAVTLWSRDDAGKWSHSVAEGLDASVGLPAIGIALQLSDIYYGIKFQSPPRLVADQT